MEEGRKEEINKKEKVRKDCREKGRLKSREK
jgi:hypothetical protein